MEPVGVSSTCGFATAQEALTWWWSWTEKQKWEKEREPISKVQGQEGVTKPSLWALGSHPGACRMEPDQNLGGKLERNMSSQHGNNMPEVLRRSSLLSKDKNSQTLEWRLVRVEAEAAAWADGPGALRLDLRWRRIQRKSKRAGGGNVMRYV